MTVVPEPEKLSAPDRFVTPIAGAVERNPDDGFTDTSMLCQQRHHMGMVVLNQIDWSIAGMSFCPITGVISGMQVGGQSNRAAPDFTELTHRALERPQGL